MVMLHVKTKIQSWTSYINCKNIDSISKKCQNKVNCNSNINL